MILVVSCGGSGTTDFIFKLKSLNIKTNHEGDEDGLKHRPDPYSYKPRPDKAIYLFDDPILANKSHFRREWFTKQCIKTQCIKDIPPENYKWEDFIKDNKDWCQMEKHWENWNNAPFPVLFLKLSDAHKYNEVISYFVGLNRPVNFFTLKTRNSKIEKNDKKITIYNNLKNKINCIDGYYIHLPYQTEVESGGYYIKKCDCILDPRITFELQKIKMAKKIFINGDIFENILEFLYEKKNNFEIYVHNSDRYFTWHSFLSLPEKCKKIYAMNNTVLNLEKVKSIPIGIKWCSTTEDLELMNKYKNNEKDINIFLSINENLFKNNEEKFKLYKKIRLECYNFFKDKKWILIKNNIPQENYYELVSRSKYVICPPGFGIDTRRFWECVYFGAIPIVLTSCMDNLYKDYKCIIINNWKDIDEDSNINTRIN